MWNLNIPAHPGWFQLTQKCIPIVIRYVWDALKPAIRPQSSSSHPILRSPRTAALEHCRWGPRMNRTIAEWPESWSLPLVDSNVCIEHVPSSQYPITFVRGRFEGRGFWNPPCEGLHVLGTPQCDDMSTWHSRSLRTFAFTPARWVQCEPDH